MGGLEVAPAPAPRETPRVTNARTIAVALSAATLAALAARGLGAPRLRPDTPPSPDGGVIADLHGADLSDPAALAAALAAVPGVVDHGLFPPALVHDVLVARDGGVQRLR